MTSKLIGINVLIVCLAEDETKLFSFLKTHGYERIKVQTNSVYNIRAFYPTDNFDFTKILHNELKTCTDNWIQVVFTPVYEGFHHKLLKVLRK